jgi:hypothetical protein
MKSLTWVGMFALAITCTSCGGYGNSSSGSPGSTTIAGNWQFTYTSSSPSSGKATVTGALTQTGNAVSSTVNITGSCATSGTLSATLIGLTLTGTLTETNPETISITGSVASSYNTSNGTYQVTSATGACASAMGDSGTWSGMRTSSPSGGYAGMIHLADRLPVGVAVTLNNDGEQLSGTATFTNSACLHSMNVTGHVSGLSLELRGDGTDSSVVMTGTMDNAAKTLALNSSVSGVCSAESGTATLTKVQ